MHTLYTGGYGNILNMPGLSWGIDSIYQQQAQIQNNYWQRLTGALIPASPPPATPLPTEKIECNEFVWLRKRVNEILWK